MRVAVAGGTGVAGRALADELEGRGHSVLVLSRSSGTDLMTAGTELDEWLAGADVVVDVTNPASQSRRRAEAFFAAVTGNLLGAEERLGIGHHVLLSIVGIDDVPSGYYLAKLAQEALVAGSAVPSTIVRATQFHEFVSDILDRMQAGPFQFVPRARFQPIAVTELASLLADVVLGPPAPSGRSEDIAGPLVQEAAELAAQLADARGGRRRRRRLVTVRIPGRGGRAIAAGALLPTGPGPRGRETYAEWLTRVDGER